MADISITPANVVQSDAADLKRLIANEAIAQGELCCLVSGKAELADAGDTTKLKLQGIALNAAAAGQPVTICRKDTALAIGATVASGKPVFLSSTAGGITLDEADLTTGDTPICIGMGVGDNKISFNCNDGFYHQATAALS